MRADLHCHTTLSDGSLGIEEVIAQAKRNNIDCLAITDHDNLASTSRAVVLGQRYGIRVLPAVEISAVDTYLEQISASGEVPKIENGKKKGEKDKKGVIELLKPISDVDIALFGRMIADSPQNSVDAAAQVAHPITIHPVVVEDDYFTAVDDLNAAAEESGAGHLGVSEYGAGVFYTYVCVNRELLIENLGGDADLANRAIRHKHNDCFLR